MSRPSYDEDPKLIDAVKDGMDRRFTYKESIAELLSIGIDINQKKLQRVRDHIRITQAEKKERFTNETLDSSVFRRIETHKTLIKELWDVVLTPREVWSKIAAIKLIYKYEKEHDEYIRHYTIYPRLVSQAEKENSNLK